MAARLPSILGGKSRRVTSSATHLYRHARWGITLARRRALVGIEEDANAPVQVKRLARLARLATLTSKKGTRDYAGAFRAIGPAAIKLGQSLATRPDLVGEEGKTAPLLAFHQEANRTEHPTGKNDSSSGGCATL